MSHEIIFIAVPVFEGQDFISETLRSIRDQTFANYRVLISIDNNDLASAEVCKSFVSDQRFDMVIHAQSLGWARNLNWLIEQCDCPFFIYWQQDDLASTNYLEVLYTELINHESASIAYTEVQWFGDKFERSSCPSIIGNASQRIFQAIEHISFIPLRGLIRGDLLTQSSGIPLSGDDFCHAEFPFLVELAVLGEFRHTSKALYFKRAHKRNTFVKWSNWEPWKRRRAWIEMGLGFLRVAQQVFPSDSFQKLMLVTVLDRLSNPRSGRAFFYQPPSHGIEEFVRDFMSLGDLSGPSDNLLKVHDLNPFIKSEHKNITKALHTIDRMNIMRNEIGKDLERNIEVIANTIQGSDGLSLLGFGWSIAESWGVWTDGENATLLLPIKRSGTYEVILEGYHYASQQFTKEKNVSLFWRIYPKQPYHKKTIASGIQTSLKLEFDLDSVEIDYPLRVELHIPDSVFLPNDGIQDERKVGFGLKKLRIIGYD